MWRGGKSVGSKLDEMEVKEEDKNRVLALFSLLAALLRASSPKMAAATGLRFDGRNLRHIRWALASARWPPVQALVPARLHGFHVCQLEPVHLAWHRGRSLVAGDRGMGP